jgi:hypothetical protein
MEWLERLNVFYDVLQVLYVVIIVSSAVVVIGPSRMDFPEACRCLR